MRTSDKIAAGIDDYQLAQKYLSGIRAAMEKAQKMRKKGKNTETKPATQDSGNSDNTLNGIVESCSYILNQPGILISRYGDTPYYEVFWNDYNCFGVSSENEGTFVVVHDVRFYQLGDLFEKTERAWAINMSIETLVADAGSILGPKYVITDPYTPNGLDKVCRDILKHSDKIEIEKNEGAPQIATFLRVKNRSNGKDLFRITYNIHDKSYYIDVFNTKYPYNKPWLPHSVCPNYACFESKWPGFDTLLPKLYKDFYVAHCKSVGAENLVYHGCDDKFYTRCDLHDCDFRKKRACALYKQVQAALKQQQSAFQQSQLGK